MSSAVTRCRSVWTGGAPMLPPPPPSTRPRAWAAATLIPLPAYAANGVTATDKGTFIAGGSGSILYRSTDGGQTFQQQAPPFAYPQAPAFGGGRVLLGGLSYNVVWGSDDDGESYQQISSTLASQNGGHTFVYGDETWVAAAGGSYGDTNTFQYSTDGGATWNLCGATGSGADFTDATLCWNGSEFVAAGPKTGTSGYVATSPDGVNWTAHPITSALSVDCCTSGAGLWVLSSSSNEYAIADSLEAVLAQAPSLLPDAGAFAMTIVKPWVLPDGTVLMFCGSGNVQFSTDQGATWQEDAPPWPYEPGGSTVLSAFPVAVYQGNVVAALNNAKKIVGVRGVNC